MMILSALCVMLVVPMSASADADNWYSQFVLDPSDNKYIYTKNDYTGNNNSSKLVTVLHQRMKADGSWPYNSGTDNSDDAIYLRWDVKDGGACPILRSDLTNASGQRSDENGTFYVQLAKTNTTKIVHYPVEDPLNLKPSYRTSGNLGEYNETEGDWGQRNVITYSYNYWNGNGYKPLCAGWYWDGNVNWKMNDNGSYPDKQWFLDDFVKIHGGAADDYNGATENKPAGKWVTGFTNHEYALTESSSNEKLSSSQRSYLANINNIKNGNAWIGYQDNGSIPFGSRFHAYYVPVNTKLQINVENKSHFSLTPLSGNYDTYDYNKNNLWKDGSSSWNPNFVPVPAGGNVVDQLVKARNITIDTIGKEYDTVYGKEIEVKWDLKPGYQTESVTFGIYCKPTYAPDAQGRLYRTDDSAAKDFNGQCGIICNNPNQGGTNQITIKTKPNKYYLVVYVDGVQYSKTQYSYKVGTDYWAGDQDPNPNTSRYYKEKVEYYAVDTYDGSAYPGWGNGSEVRYYYKTKPSLTVSAGTGISSVSGSKNYITPGSEVNISAVVKPGYNWNCWTEKYGRNLPTITYVSGIRTDANKTQSVAYSFKINAMPYNNLDLTANAVARSDTSYTVNHYTRNLDGTNWALYKTESNKTGKTDTAIPSTKINITGFTYSHTSYQNSGNGSTTSGTINGNGSTIVNNYYERNSYNLTLSSGTGINGVTGSGTYKYEQTIIGITAKLKPGYNWNDWNGDKSGFTISCTNNPRTYDNRLTEQTCSFKLETMPARDVTLTAVGSARNDIPYTVTYIGANTSGTFTSDTVLLGTDVINGTTDTTATPSKKENTFLGFSVWDHSNPSSGKITVLGNGTAKLTQYMKRNQSTLTINTDDGKWENTAYDEFNEKSIVTFSQKYYETTQKIPQPVKEGYTFER